MKRMIILSLLLAASAFAEVSTTDINRDTVQPANRLVDLLRNKIGDLNTDIANLGNNLGTGKVFYVDSGAGSDTYNGTKPEWAKATLDAAVGLCTADRGDIIYVMQGHSETMGAAADEVDIDVAGVTVIGMGSGELRPRYDFTGDVTGAFAVGADDVTIINLNFHANITDVNEAIEVEAGSENLKIIGCLFDLETEGTDDFLECIDTSGGAASDGLQVIGCQFYMGAGACNAAICTKDSDYMRVVGCEFYGDYATANINNLTTASNHITIKDNLIFNGTIGGNAGLNAQPGIELVATTTGIISNNMIACNLATKAAAVVAADCYLFENYYNEDESSAATGGIIGTASADD